MTKGNTTRYSRSQQDDVMFKIDQQLDFELMKAEVVADMKAAKSYVSRAKSVEAVKLKADEKIAATSHLKGNSTVSNLMAALEKQKAEFEKLIEDKAHAPPKALKKAKRKASAPIQKKKEKKGKNSNSKNNNKGRTNQPTQAVKKRQEPSTPSTPSTKKHKWHHRKPYRSTNSVTKLIRQQK